MQLEDPKLQKKMIEAFKKAEFDEVLFVDPEGIYKDTYISLRSTLENAGIIVGDSLYQSTGQTSQAIVSGLPNRETSDQSVRSYSHVTFNTYSAPGICTLSPNQPELIKSKIDTHSRELELKPFQIKYVLDKLDREINRNITKYGKGDESKIKNNIVTVRLANLRETRAMLQEHFESFDQKKDNRITYHVLEQSLIGLENKMRTTGIFKATAKKEIENIRKQVVGIRPSK